MYNMRGLLFEDKEYGWVILEKYDRYFAINVLIKNEFFA